MAGRKLVHLHFVITVTFLACRLSIPAGLRFDNQRGHSVAAGRLRQFTPRRERRRISQLVRWLFPVVLVFQTARVFAICECWITEHIDDWTEEKSLVLVCSDQDAESAVILFDSLRVEFFDATAKAQNGVLVSWEYRVGDSAVYRLSQLWNRETQPPNLSSEDHFPILLHGIGNSESIRFRLLLLTSSGPGRVNVLRDCLNAKESADLFAPLVPGLAHQ